MSKWQFLECHTLTHLIHNQEVLETASLQEVPFSSLPHQVLWPHILYKLLPLNPFLGPAFRGTEMYNSLVSASPKPP